MDEEPLDSSTDHKERDRPQGQSGSYWPFRIMFAVCALGAAYVLLAYGIGVFTWITDRLPLLLPLAVTVMSISTRATEIRSYEAVLKTSNDIAIGIISFDIWLLSTRSAQTGRVLVNQTTIIRGDFAIAFLVLGLAIAVGSLILTHYEFRSGRGKRRALLVGFAVTVLAYVAPFGVLEPLPPPAPAGPPTAEMKHFAVAIPYRDPAITAIAPAYLGQRLFVHFEHDVEAPSPDAAKAAALQRFLQGDDSNQIRTKGEARIGEKVIVEQKEILVGAR